MSDPDANDASAVQPLGWTGDVPPWLAQDGAPSGTVYAPDGDPPPPAVSGSGVSPYEHDPVADASPSATPAWWTPAQHDPSLPFAEPSPALGASQLAVPPWLAGVQPVAAPQTAPQSRQAQAGPGGVDAVSGAPTSTGEDPHAALYKIATNVDASDADRQKAWQQLTPDERTNLVNSADPKQMAALANASMSPEELATIQLRHTQQQIHEQSAAQLNLSVQQDQDARQSFQAYQNALNAANAQTADVDQQAKALAQQKIDPNEHGVGHFIASVLTAAVGGFASPATGGRNLALEELDKQTERRIQAQKDSIANQWQGLNFKRNLIQEQLGRSGDLYKAQTTYQLSQYDRALGELQTRMQDYDPQGTTSLRIAGQVQQIQAQRVQALQAFNNQQIKNSLDEANAAKARAEANKANAEAQAKLAKTGGTGTAAPSFVTVGDAKKAFPQLAGSFGATSDDTKIPLSQPFTGTAKNFDELNKRAGEVAESSSKRTAADQAQAGTVVRDGHGQPLTEDGTPNGKPVIASSKEDATKLNEENANLQKAIDGAREMSRILRSEPSTIDRGTWSKLKGLMGTFEPEVAGLLGAKFSSREEEAIKNISGMDFDSWKRSYGEVFKADQMDQFADGLYGLGQEKAKRIAGYHGDWQKVIFDPGQLPAAQDTPQQTEIKKAATNLDRADRGQLDSNDQQYRDLINGSPLDRKDKWDSLSEPVKEGVLNHVYPSRYMQFTQNFQLAQSANKTEAAQGRNFLQEMANGASDQHERDLANSLIQALRGSDAKTASEPIGPTETQTDPDVDSTSGPTLAPTANPMAQAPWWGAR